MPQRITQTPLSEYAVLDERIAILEKQVRMLRSAQHSTMLTSDASKHLDPMQGEVIVHHPGTHVTAAITDPVQYWHDGEWKALGAGSGPAVYAIEVFENAELCIAGDGAFEWEIPEDLDDSVIVKVEGYVTTPSSSGSVQVQIRNETTGHDVLTNKIVIDQGELNSKDAGTQPVVDSTHNTVAWGDHLNVDVDAAGAASTGLGVILYFAPSPTARVVLEGYRGVPGGVTNWSGTWDYETTYIVGEVVSDNGTSYVATAENTDVQPGVDTGWQDSWMVVAQSITWRGTWSAATAYAVQDAVTNNSSSYVATAPSTNVEPGVDAGWQNSWQVLAQGNVNKELQIIAVQSNTLLTAGDGKCFYVISDLFNTKNLVRAEAAVITASTSGSVSVQIRNTTQAVDMLTTAITVDQGEYSSYTAAAPSVVNSGNSDVAVGDILAIDVDDPGTGAMGLIVILTFTA